MRIIIVVILGIIIGSAIGIFGAYSLGGLFDCFIEIRKMDLKNKDIYRNEYIEIDNEYDI